MLHRLTLHNRSSQELRQSARDRRAAAASKDGKVKALLLQEARSASTIPARNFRRRMRLSVHLPGILEIAYEEFGCAWIPIRMRSKSLTRRPHLGAERADHTLALREETQAGPHQPALARAEQGFGSRPPIGRQSSRSPAFQMAEVPNLPPPIKSESATRTGAAVIVRRRSGAAHPSKRPPPSLTH